MELLVVLLLILLNGFFAMAEIAIISSRKSKLQTMVDDGNKGAGIALELLDDSSRFISTIQLGITVIGIVAGVFGGATLADKLAGYLSTVPYLQVYAHPIAYTVVVVLIAYFSLIGELVPKRLALINTERIAAMVAAPMSFFYSITSPIVRFLSFSTQFTLSLFRVKNVEESSVSEEEVQMLLNEGTESGVFEEAEADIIERTLRLDDKKANSLMTNRNDIVWIDINSEPVSIRETLLEQTYSYFPVCDKTLDTVVGVIRSEELLLKYLSSDEIKLHPLVHKPLFIPEGMDALSILELFKTSGIQVAIVVDEYGSVQGLVSMNDIMEAIVGDLPTMNEIVDQEIVQRDDGSWLVDGLTTIDDFKDYFEIRKMKDEDTGDFQTIGGYVMNELNRIPAAGDRFELDGFSYEVMDMDGNRVDKVLVNKVNA